MLKKTIPYVDYNGVERKEDFYFNLDEAEIAEMELSTVGGYSEMVKSIIAADDRPTLIKIFKELILKTYGVKSPDGKQFVKNEEVSTAFKNTRAYSVLFMELATNTEAAIEFVNGVIPENMRNARNEKETGLSQTA